MGRSTARARDRAAREPEHLAPLVRTWWETVLAGETGEPHPIHGERVIVRVDGGTLKLSGELEAANDRDELIRQARGQIGHGIDEVDSSGLTVPAGDEKRGLLDQVLVAAFPNRRTAELALKLVLARSRVVLKHHAILAPGDARPGTSRRLKQSVPDEFIADVSDHLDDGRAVLVILVDETDAFRVRGLLEEDTRSLWTVAVPPQDPA